MCQDTANDPQGYVIYAGKQMKLGMILARKKSWKFQAPKTKYQTNPNDQNSKFKTGTALAVHNLSGRIVSVIGIWDLGFFVGYRRSKLLISESRSCPAESYDMLDIHKYIPYSGIW